MRVHMLQCKYGWEGTSVSENIVLCTQQRFFARALPFAGGGGPSHVCCLQLIFDFDVAARP